MSCTVLSKWFLQYLQHHHMRAQNTRVWSPTVATGRQAGLDMGGNKEQERSNSKSPAKSWVRRSEAKQGQKGLVGGSPAGLEQGKRLIMGSHSGRRKAPVCMGGNRTCPTWPQEQAMLPGAAAGCTQFRYAPQDWGATLTLQPVSSWPAQALRALRIGDPCTTPTPACFAKRGHCKALHSCNFLSEPPQKPHFRKLQCIHSAASASWPGAAVSGRHSLGALVQEGLHAVAVRAHHVLHDAQQPPPDVRHLTLPLLHVRARWHAHTSK